MVGIECRHGAVFFIGYDYKFTDSISVPNNLDATEMPYQQSFNGKGGISQVYFGLSASFLKHFSLGVSAYYLWQFIPL